MSEHVPLLTIADLDVHFGRGANATPALSGVSLEAAHGSAMGIVGESGSGKSTLAKTIVGIHRPTSGTITFDGVGLTGARGRSRALRRRIQYIPQDPYSSLDPRRTIGQTLAEAVDPVRARVRAHRDQITASLAAVTLDEDAVGRYPHEFSGGQRQRIAIARALITEPDLVIADEITSALDVSTQAEILVLLARLRRELDLTMLFISHNLAVVHDLCDEVLVLLHGEVVEHDAVGEIFRRPRSPYTRHLVESVPGGPAFQLDVAG